MTNAHAPNTYDDLRDQFEDESVLAALDRAHHDPDYDDLVVLFLDEDSGRIYRVLDATRGSPDSGWFVLALAGPHPDDDFRGQRCIHDSDTHRVLVTSRVALTNDE